MKVVWALALVLVLPSIADAQERSKGTAFKVGVACSVATNVLDVHSTWYALHDKSLGLREGNVWLVRTAEDDWGKLAVIKAVGTGAVVGGAWVIEERNPRWANALLYGDCVLKSATAARNYYLANQQKDAVFALSLKASF